MANSWNGPQLGSPIRTDVPELQKKLIALLKQDPTSVANIPSGAKRLVNTSGVQWQVQQYNGSSWAAIGKLMHDVDKLDGYDAAITPAANTVAVRNASGVLEDSITGNAATASSAATLSQTLPVNMGGTGATTSAAARTNLGVPPTSHASSSTTYGLGTNTNYGHVRSDGDTTNIVAGEVIVKDVAIGGDVTDLASERGIFNTKGKGSVDYNTLLNQGFYAAYATGSTNGPGGAARRVIVLADTKDDDNPTQIAVTSNSSVSEQVQLDIRSRNTTGGWSDWVKFISEHDVATASVAGIMKPGKGMTVNADGSLNVNTASTSKAGIVQLNNTVTSTSTTQAATANAVKTAYDKAEEASTKAGLPLGHIYLWPFPTPQDGSIQVNGSEYNRELYSDLWTLIQEKGWYKPESEWQQIASGNGGYCPWYSDGDGSTTFRTPKFAPYQKLTLASGNAGKYYEAGLPDHSHNIQVRGWSRDCGYASGSPQFWADWNTGSTGNASESNAIYGKSTTVQPESNDWIVCVVAFGTATNVGSVDVANVMSAVSQVQANPHVVETWKSTDGTSWYRKYSDGWIEQGGPMSTNEKVTFHASFSNTNYYIDVTWNGGKSEAFWPVDWQITKSSKTYFTTTATTNANNVRGLCWYACGY